MNQDVEELGCKVLHQWATLGEFDFVNVVEAPDAATIARVSIALGARGSTKIQTLPALPIDEFLRCDRELASAARPPPRPRAGVRGDERAVGGERPAAASLVEERKDERRHRLAGHAARRGLGERLLDQRLDVVEALVRRPGEQRVRRRRAPSAPARPRPPRRRLDARRGGGPPRAE